MSFIRYEVNAGLFRQQPDKAQLDAAFRAGAAAAGERLALGHCSADLPVFYSIINQRRGRPGLVFAGAQNPVIGGRKSGGITEAQRAPGVRLRNEYVLQVDIAPPRFSLRRLQPGYGGSDNLYHRYQFGWGNGDDRLEQQLPRIFAAIAYHV